MTTLEQTPTLTKMPSPRVMPPDDPATEIIYPESDGLPMADTTEQFDYIVRIQGGIAAQFRDDPDVFVAGDLFWYPVEGDNKTRVAPDVLVAFGRPKGRRGSYLQWREGGIAPQVVFEIVSPSNTWTEMARKLAFYEHHGVEEYYLFDPQRGDLAGWLRDGDDLVLIEEMEGWVSPRLGATFRLTPEGELELVRPDGRRFETAAELDARFEAEHERAEAERERAEAERERAEAERERAEAEHERAEAEHERAERLAAQLRTLGIDPATV